MKTARIWTPFVRDLLFETVTNKFGPYSTWEHHAYPSVKRRDEYDAFLARFAEHVGASGPRAVEVQLSWAYETPKDRQYPRSLLMNLFLNQAAGLNSGFTSSEQVPWIGHFPRDPAVLPDPTA